MRVLRLGWLGVRTTNFERERAFFAELLGMEMTEAENDFAMFRLPTPGRELVEIFGPATDWEPAKTWYDPSPVVGFVVDDLDGARQELLAAGIAEVEEIVRPSSTPGYGWFHFRAPGGQAYALIEDRQPE